MDIYTELKTVLAGIEVLGGRIFPTAAPEGASFPFCVYIQESRDAVALLDQPAELAWYTIRLIIIAESYSAVVAIEKQVKAAIEGELSKSDNVVGLEWLTEQPEGYETELTVQRRSPSVRILYKED